jgi:hypothetical protein
MTNFACTPANRPHWILPLPYQPNAWLNKPTKIHHDMFEIANGPWFLGNRICLGLGILFSISISISFSILSSISWIRFHICETLRAISLILRLGHKDHTSHRCNRQPIAYPNIPIYRSISEAFILTVKVGQRETECRTWSLETEAKMCSWANRR